MRAATTRTLMLFPMSLYCVLVEIVSGQSNLECAECALESESEFDDDEGEGGSGRNPNSLSSSVGEK